MIEEYELVVGPFEMGAPKESSVKVLEEAAEAFGAWQIYEECYEFNDRPSWMLTEMADEIADTIQAACNLAARYDLDLSAAMERCEQRNRERGRYE